MFIKDFPRPTSDGQSSVFLYIGSPKGDTLLPSLYAAMETFTVEISRLCLKLCLDFGNKPFFKKIAFPLKMTHWLQEVEVRWCQAGRVSRIRKEDVFLFGKMGIVNKSVVL